jgi:hypothetical protein
MTKCAHCKLEDTELYENGIPLCLKCSDKREAKTEPLATEQEIRVILLQDMLEAAARNNTAIQEFELVKGQFPSGLPHPDGSQRNGSQRTKNASSVLSVARKGMMKAHNQLNDYLERGIVPNDLKRSG